MIVVMGSTGNCGAVVVRRLLAYGHQVRALGRSRERLQPLVDAGAQISVGDTTDPRYLTDAFVGADRVFTLLPDDFLSTAHRAWQDRIGEATITAVKNSSVKYLVLVSSLGAGHAHGTGLVAGLHAQEERLRALSEVNILVLRNGWFFENFLGDIDLIQQQGVNTGAIAPDLPVAMIAASDVADTAAAALHNADFVGFTVRELLGQRDLTFAEATRLLGKRIGEPALKYRQLSYADNTELLIRAGLSADVATLFTDMSRAVNDGLIRTEEGRTTANTTPTPFEKFADTFAGAGRFSVDLGRRRDAGISMK